MEATALSPSDRFNSLVERMFDDVRTAATHPWRWESLIDLVLVKLIWRRLRRMRRRFATIMARVRAGTLGQTATRPAAVRDRPAASPRAERPSQRSGWVIYAISWFLWNRHYELDELLEDPAMVAQVAAAPQLGGVLRPMCQMLAVKPPAWLRRPRKPRRRVERPPAPDFIMNDPAAIHRPDGTIWKRFGASTNWRKPDLLWDTLEQAQKFDRPRRIWPPRK